MVDDYEAWRRFVCSTLQRYPTLKIVGELSDGLAAVEEAQQLQPDLVLLDIGLPHLHGIEAARLIRQVSPKSKIIFLSENCSQDIAEEALQTGAQGYVVKSDAARELLPALEAVLAGSTFISGSLQSRPIVSAQKNTTVPHHAEALSNSAVQNVQHQSRHEVGFYWNDEAFVHGLTRLIGAAIRDGSIAIVVATESHRERLLPRLQAHGLDLITAIEQHQFLALDAAATLSSVIVNGNLDRESFLEVAGNLIVNSRRAANRENPRVAIFGECDPPFWAIAAEAAIQVEQFWNEIMKKYDVDIFCAYSLSNIQHFMNDALFRRICAEHSAVHSHWECDIRESML